MMKSEHAQFAIDRLPDAHPALLECAREFLRFLGRRIPAVFADCSDRLFELAAASRSDAEQTRYFDGRCELELRRGRLCRAFIERLDAGLADFVERRRLAAPPAPAAERTELRVLDDRDLTVTLAVDAIVDSAEVRLTRELYALGVRLGAVVGSGPLANDINPMGPRALCQAFRDALVTVESEVEVHQALYQSFDRGIVRALGELYPRINDTLARGGIVPELKYAVRRAAGRPTPDEPEEAATESVLEREAQATAAALERRIFARVQSLLAQRRALLWPAPSAPPVPTHTLREILSSLQTELAAGGADEKVGAAAIKSTLLEYGGDGRPCSLTPRDEDTIDLLGLMFDCVVADRQLPEPFQAALRRLQVPYLRAALQDPDLVAAPTSAPARLLEELSRTGIGWTVHSDREGETLAKINEVVDQVITRFWDDTAVLENLLSELVAYRQARERLAERRARRVRQAMRGSEQLAFARQNVAQLLHRRLKNRSLPPLVRELLERAWSHVMVLAVLQHGLHSSQWKRALATADELIWSVSFERSDRAVARLRTRMPALTAALAGGLKQIGYSDAEIDKILTGLTRLQTALIEDSGSDRVLLEIDDAGISISGESLLDPALLQTTDSAEDEAGLTEMLAQVRAWQPGKWVVFHRDQGEELRAKLSWISPLTGRYLFVDQRGLRAAEKSLRELAVELAEHHLEPLSDEGVVTRALTRVAARLRRDVAAVAH